MKHGNLRSAAAAALCIPVFALSICATGCSRKAAAPGVTVGSKNFTEQLILAEIMARMIEGRTGLRVVRRLNLGGTMICHRALNRGEIDVYAEYTGTALTAIL
jgi:glycine betaine/choline ABC-type transport system substrate-binding protein